MASNLEGILKVWNKEVFGRVETKKEALRRVVFWDDLEKVKELTREEVEERENAKRTIRTGLIWKRSLRDRNLESFG